MNRLRCLAVYILYLGVLVPTLEAHTAKRIGFWSTWNIPCGIAMYTKHVTDSLLKLGYQVTHYDNRLAPETLIAAAFKDQIQVLAIQYESNIMPPKNAVLHVIRQAKNAGIRVVITIHAEPSYAQALVNAADATVYHKPPRYLRNTAKVHVFPMAVPVFNTPSSRQELRQKYGFSIQDKILVSTGFMLPSKEIDKILEHFVPALKRDPSIKLQLIHPFNPLDLEGGALVYNRVVDIMKRYQLYDQITLIADFVPQDVLSERIFISDLGYQWYCADTTASSAVAKEYISARTPLVIPDFTHFQDIHHYHGIKVTWRDHAIFVDTIIKLLYQPARLRVMRSHLSKLYNQLNYDVMIRGYDAVFQAL